LASSSLRLTNRCFFQLNPCGNSPYVTSSQMRRGFASYEYAWLFVKFTYRTYSIIENYFFCTIRVYKSSVSTALQSRSYPSYVSYSKTAAQSLERSKLDNSKV
jgi:hypothetical protein